MSNRSAFALMSLALVLAGCGASAQPLAGSYGDPTFGSRANAQPVAAPRVPSGLSARAATAPTAAGEGLPFEVVTYNTWGKPGILGTDKKRRMELIGPAIRPFPVAALQETFTRYSARMADLSGFPYQKWQDNRGLFHLSSGLYTLSKYPIVETDFLPFKEAGDFDRYAKKGVLFTRIDVPGYGLVDLYNTHYQSQSGEKFSAIRKHDNSVMEAIVKKHDAGHPSFLLGDFNMTADSPEYQDLMARLPLRDSHLVANPGEPGYTVRPDNPHKKPDVRLKRIDYVFVLSGDRPAVKIEAAEVMFDEPIDGVVMSDHYGLRARFTLPARP